MPALLLALTLFIATPVTVLAQATATSELEAIQALYSKGDYDSSLQRMAEWERLFPGDRPERESIRNLRGLIYLRTKRPESAIAQFRLALSGRGSPQFIQHVSYNLAAALLEANQPGEAESTLNGIQLNLLDKDNRIKFSILKGRALNRQTKFDEAARVLLTGAKEATSEPDTLKAFSSQIEVSLQGIREPAAVTRLWERNTDSPIGDAVLFRLAQTLSQAGQSDQATEKLALLKEKFPKSPLIGEATESVGAGVARANSKVNANRVGALLPLTGRLARFGQASLLAMSQAFRFYGQDEDDSGITLVVEDAGDSAEQALVAFDKLVNEHGVIAVIGPLSSRGLDELAKRAQERGVPLLSLAPQIPQMDVQPEQYVLNTGLNAKLQAESIAKHAVTKLGLKRFAILHGRDKTGEQYAQFFWDAVERLGGEVRGVESYPGGETDFIDVIDRLVGRYYKDARVRELAALDQERKEKKIKKRTRKTEQYFTLPPVVDFDAVFIADDPRTTGQILPTFAFRDVDKVKYLGTALWNSPDIAARAQNFAEGILFVDAWFNPPLDRNAQRFARRFEASFGQAPGAIEALAYDAATVLEKVLSVGADDRGEVREQLAQIKDYPGVTGKLSVTGDLLDRELLLLTVKAGVVRPAQSAQ
jgi:branched-chain amino acid transport system substrate-binding protein